jgi:hypothetical protein
MATATAHPGAGTAAAATYLGVTTATVAEAGGSPQKRVG